MKFTKKLWLGPKQPFARVQFLLIAALVVITGAVTVAKILAGNGTLYLAPSTTAVNIGDTVTVGVRENSLTDTVNAVEADLRFDATKLEYVGVSETGSAFGVVAATNVSTGAVNIARGVNGGSAPVSGDQLVTTVTFKALAAGTVPVTLVAPSALVRSTDSTSILAASTDTTLVLADTGAPTVPANLATSAVTMSSVGLTWTASTDNVATAGYKIYRDGTQIDSTSATNYTAVSLLPNTSYTFSISAVDAANNVSAVSPVVTAKTLADSVAPSIPGVPASSVQSVTGITVNWPASTDNVGVVSYRLFRNGAQIATPSATTFVDQGLTPATTYSYTVAAVDAAGNASAQSAPGIFKTLTDTLAPTVPSGVTSSVSGVTVSLTWLASTDNIGVAGYIIYRDGLQIATSDTNRYTVLNALTGTHSYTVVAVDAAGNKSAQSTGVSASVWGVGDINHDGKVSVFDLSILLSNWSHSGVNTADLNADSVVNVFDLSILLSHWTG